MLSVLGPWPRPCSRLARPVLGVRFAAVAAAAPRNFREAVSLEGITIVATEKAARRALEELRRCSARPHAWDTETTGERLFDGHVVCATCYCGDDVDFGNGPRLFVDNHGPAAGLLKGMFQGYFEDQGFKKIFHNYSFDRHMLKREGIQIRGLQADTLHMARLWDTSRASWEGRVQSKLHKEAVAKQAPPPPQASSVLGVRLGGKKLDGVSWGGTSGLHTMVEASPQLLYQPPGRPLEAFAEAPAEASADAEAEASADAEAEDFEFTFGYGLKDLAKYFRLDPDSEHLNFAQRFGLHGSASTDAHDSPEAFPDWVRYATTDAVVTHRLYAELHGQLKSRPWLSQVHEPAVDVLLRDRAVALQLLAGRGRGQGAAPKRATGRTMWDLFRTYFVDYAECLADLEEVGLGTDREELGRMEVEWQRRAEESHRDFVECFASIRGPDGELLNPDAQLINIGSAQQIRTLLFGGSANLRYEDTLDTERAFPVPDRGLAEGKRRFEVRSLELRPSEKRKDFSMSGWPKTSREILDKLAGSSEANRAGDAYRQLVERGMEEGQAELASRGLQSLRQAAHARKVTAGFTGPLQRFAEKTGRIHPQWRFDTSTGRLCCRSPNLQNLPPKIRKAFVASPGCSFVVADYTQLELRVLAHMANSHTMIRKLEKDGDYHSEVAAEMFPHVGQAVRAGECVIDGDGGEGKPNVKKLFPTERTAAKAINFGIVFGKTAGSLAEDLSISESESEMLIEAWHTSKPEVKKWIDGTKREARKSKRVTSLLGRWRNLPLIDREEFRSRSERAAVNFGIQGSAADIVLAAMLLLWRDEAIAACGYRIVAQVHDEFVLEGPMERADEVAARVSEIMCAPFRKHSPHFNLRVPLTVDVHATQTLEK